jgi:hypothetical protein
MNVLASHARASAHWTTCVVSDVFTAYGFVTGSRRSFALADRVRRLERKLRPTGTLTV